MSVVVYPTGARVAHWTGALQRRVKQAPLERFVRLHDPASWGSKRFNAPAALVSAVGVVLDAALAAYTAQNGGALNEEQCWVIGCACAAIADGFAAGIEQPEEWLLAALKSAEQHLEPPLGADAATQCSILSVQNYLDGRVDLRGPREFGALCRAAMHALVSGSSESLKVATRLVSQRILSRRAVPSFKKQAAAG